jgi:hypothetical protein
MIDLTKIPDDTLMARGKYSTIRGAHEDEKKRLAILAGELGTAATQILRRMQPDNDDVPESVDELFEGARATLEKMDACVTSIYGLATKRKELKPLAWAKP